MRQNLTLLINFLLISSIQLLLIKGHPLDPLSIDEIQQGAQIISLSKNTSTSWGFNYVQLKEPPKNILLPYFLAGTEPPDGLVDRKCFAIVLENILGNSYEAVVNLNSGEIESWELIPEGIQPVTSGIESDGARATAMSDPQVIQRCAALGYSMENVFMADWTMGYIGDRPEYIGKRYVQMFIFGKSFNGDNYYAHPFPFIVTVDILNFKVIDIINVPTHNDFDTENPIGVEIPKDNFQYDQDLLGEEFIRKDIKPLNIEFPEGPSYKVNGNLIEWQKFRFRVGFTAREGLVLHHVTYNESGVNRPLVYRASLSEMVVPYGDPRSPFHRKSEFDEGGYGLGTKASELILGQDCIGSVHFFDIALGEGDGTGTVLPNRICVQEEDGGILWRHTDESTSKNHVARSRKLSLSFTCRIDNYDYIFYWYFHQDATIEMSVKLTGILNTNMLAVGSVPTPHSTPLSPQLNAQFHQHIFAVRLDLDIEGPNNTVSLVELVSMDEETGSEQNPYGQGLVAKSSDLKTSSEARTKTSPLSGRVWKIQNNNILNPANNQPVSYKLVPGNHQELLMKNGSPVRGRANFTAFDVWVTPYDERQLYAAGDYIGQTESEGLPKWVQENPGGNILDTDIVLWHVFGVSHLPRLEDWPIMPVESCGFTLKPAGFFNQNPALDVPALRNIKEKLEI